MRPGSPGCVGGEQVHLLPLKLYEDVLMSIDLDAQIQLLESYGVEFNIVTRDEAKTFLSRNTYFFKLKSYKANYQPVNGMQQPTFPIEFAFLMELSKVDFHLGRLCWAMCMGVEHSIKIRLNRRMMDYKNPTAIRDAGRAFVNNYLSKEPSYAQDPSTMPSKRYKEVHANYYTEDLVAAKQDDFAPWHLWELLSFGKQVELYFSMLGAMGEHDPNRHLLLITQKLRNAVSHGNCLLTNLATPIPSMRTDSPKPDRQVLEVARTLCTPSKKPSRKKKDFDLALERLVVHNYAALLHCYLFYVESDGMLQHAIKEVSAFIERINANKEAYFGRGQLPTSMQIPNKDRNQLILSTLNALIRLSEGFIKHAEAKLHGKAYPDAAKS